jgi:hypothetical protein
MQHLVSELTQLTLFPPHGNKHAAALFSFYPNKEIVMSVKGHIKEAAGYVKEEAHEHSKTAKGQEKAAEGRELRNEGRIEDGKAPKTNPPGTEK